jgi:hypothetical protein
MALACGATVENAGRKAGVSRRTATRRLAEPGFREHVRQLRADMVQRSTAMLTAAALEAVKTLVELEGSVMPAPVRLGAARAILELGGKLRESTELAERLAALEQQMGLPSDSLG